MIDDRARARQGRLRARADLQPRGAAVPARPHRGGADASPAPSSTSCARSTRAPRRWAPSAPWSARPSRDDRRGPRDQRTAAGARASAPRAAPPTTYAASSATSSTSCSRRARARSWAPDPTPGALHAAVERSLDAFARAAGAAGDAHGAGLSARCWPSSPCCSRWLGAAVTESTSYCERPDGAPQGDRRRCSSRTRPSALLEQPADAARPRREVPAGPRRRVADLPRRRGRPGRGARGRGGRSPSDFEDGKPPAGLSAADQQGDRGRRRPARQRRRGRRPPRASSSRPATSARSTSASEHRAATVGTIVLTLVSAGPEQLPRCRGTPTRVD